MEVESAEDGARKRVRTQERDLQPNDANSFTREPTIPRRVACTHCRQSKLRCDSPKDPCSRCDRLGLTCTKDTSYKRVNRTSKIDQLEKHVQELRDVLDHNRAPTSISTSPEINMKVMPAAPMPYSGSAVQASNFNSSPQEASTAGSTSFAPLSGTPKSLTHESPLTVIESPFPATNRHPGEGPGRPRALKARALESTALGREQIDVLFQIYFNRFHSFLPVLDPLRSPDEYYDSCHFLFWMMIAIASRRYHEDMTILSGLAVSVPKLAWERVADHPLPYTVVQALLIFCMWPFPNTHIWSDASASFSSIAFNAAFHMGLHKPDHAGEFVRYPRSSKPFYLNSRDPLERRKTWAGVNIVSHFMVVSVGYPPTGSCFDWSVDRFCETGNPHTLTDDLRYNLIIQRFSYRVSKVMSTNVADPLGLPPDSQYTLIMKVLEHDLDALEGQIWPNLHYIDRIYFRCARLQLGVYHWLGPSSTETRLGIIKSYAAAFALVNEILSADASYGVLAYGPIIYPRMMFTAAYLILKVLNSSFSQHVDCEAGATLFHSIVAAIRRCSIEENDQAIRGANILADVWYRRAEIIEDKSKEPVLVTRSRLGASLMYDCLWRWKEQCLKAESLQNANPGPIGWNEVRSNSTESPAQPIDATLVPFDWDLFDDTSWSWNFDIPASPYA